MYNEKILDNTKLYEVDTVQGEIYFVNNFKRVDKSRPVLIISDWETVSNGIITALTITTKHHHPGSFPILIDGTVSFVLPYQEYTMTANELFTYGRRIGCVPMRSLEMIKYMKFRIYGSPRSDLHEKAIFDHSIGIFRKLISGEFKLSRSSDVDLTAENFLGGRFSRFFKTTKKLKNTKSTKKVVDLENSTGTTEIYYPEPEEKFNDEAEVFLSNADEFSEESTELVYVDNANGESFNTMESAIMKAMMDDSGKTKNTSKLTDQLTDINDDAVADEADKKEVTVTKIVAKPYAYIDAQGHKKIKKVKDMTDAEKSLLLFEVYSKQCYTDFAMEYNMAVTTIKKRCLDCMVALDTAGLKISDEEKEYFLTDQRVHTGRYKGSYKKNLLRGK